MKAYLPPKWRSHLSLQRARTKMAFGIKSEGFFIPYPYARDARPPQAPYAALERMFEARLPEFRAFIEEMANHLPAFERFGEDPRDPSWGPSMFPAPDGAAAYAMVRRLRPGRILEIGSGNSTHFLARAMRDGGIDGRITCIDPAPRRAIDALGVEAVRRMLTEDDAGLCADFFPNDILFIDSSHIMLPGLDVDIQFNRMFPLLAPGTVVHLHDIFLPYDYPPSFRERFYSEQNALVGWIASGYFEILFPAHYAYRVLGDVVREAFGHRLPQVADAGPGSIWLRRPLRPDA
jgi:predicted O-methyltransferase YrrM